MYTGVASSTTACPANSTPSLYSSQTDNSDTIKLRNDGDDPYVGFANFPPLECHATEMEKEIVDDMEEEMEDHMEEYLEQDEEMEVDEVQEGGDEAIIDKLRPCIGMEFSTAEEAYGFYNAYAGHIGFSIRKNNQGKSRKGVTSCRFVCHKEGLSKRQRIELNASLSSSADQKSPQRVHGTTRTNCKASLRVKLTKRGLWEITVFNENHNHELLKSLAKKRNLRSQKCMSQEVTEIIHDMNAHNVGTSKIYEYVAMKQGGRRQLRFNKKDVSNQVSKEKRRIIGVDVETTLAYFMKRQEEDPEFFFSIDADENGHTRHIFWIDGRARRAYLEFGDVVTFDTTYNTNRYGMPLAPFIGVNHHRQSIFFGTWLKAMYGKHPVSILTDQDPAMKKAIGKIFPNTMHRCCQWHVMRKAREKFLKLYHTKPGFEDELKSVINRSLTVLDFEQAWGKMLENHKLKNGGHLKVMYDKRDEWIPAYFRDTFFADMSTTQRSESMNAILKLWLDNHTSIYQFVQKVEMMIEGIWDKESNEDIKNINEQPRMWSPFAVEHQARDLYTLKNYAVFKEILKESCVGIVIEHERDKRYEVSIKANPLAKKWKSESWIIEVDKATESFSCNCKGFEFEGFLCQHAIKVLHHIGFESLPKKYILGRWCKGANMNAKRSVEDRCRDISQSKEALQSFRRTKLSLEYKKVEDLASDCAEDFEFALSSLMALLNLLESKKPKTVQPQVVAYVVAPVKPITYLDPPLSQCKGRPKRPGRHKPLIEENAKQRRTCSYCGTKEAHNIRTCPKRLRDIGKGKKQLESECDEDEENTDDVEDSTDNEI